MSSTFRILNPFERDANFENRCAFTVMAKAPIAGRVKTRLSPPLTSEQAAALNANFLRDTLANLGQAAAECGDCCVVSYTPVGFESAFRGILPEETLLLPQRGDGFGERLHATAADLFSCGFSAVCLIDSDSPTVPTSEFIRASRELLSAKAEGLLLGCSDDGGYYLLGMTQPHAHLFEDIEWSTEKVAEQTEQRAAALGLRVSLLRTWYDVDEAASLARLCRELEGGAPDAEGYAAPHTRAFLRALDLSALSGQDRVRAEAVHARS